MHESSPPKNVGLNIINTPLRPLRNRSLLHFLPLLSHQPQTYLRFPHSNSPKPVLALHPHHSMLNEVAGCTHAHRPLQHLFRPYPKPTLHPHPYPCLHLNNWFHEIKSMFDTSTNLQLRCQYKLIFRLHHNKLLYHTTSINIP